ncbi:COG4223 family protein [Oceaniglobus indicus]|uniref:COG4223 family protein n=1 Tax=Oceaniglobus indicus TaxID=2047749 RepID=UPI000C1999B4|nr:hypothetical protein [Oceaniglobus indicus]
MAKSDKSKKSEDKPESLGDESLTSATDATTSETGGNGRLTDPDILVPGKSDAAETDTMTQVNAPEDTVSADDSVSTDDSAIDPVSPIDATPSADLPGGDDPAVFQAETEERAAAARDPDTATPPPPPGSTPELAPVPVEAPRIAKGPGFFTLLLGGLVAGAIGYALASFGVLNPNAETGEQRMAEIAQRLDDQSSRLDTLSETATGAATQAEAAASQDDLATVQDQIATVSAALDDLRADLGAASAAAPAPTEPAEAGDSTPSQAETPDLTPLMALPERVAELSDRLDEIAARVDTIAADVEDKAPLSGLDAYETQLQALQSNLDEQRAAIDDARSAAADARTAAADETNRITVQAALAQIAAALESGEPFVAPVADLRNAGAIDVPAALGDVANDGVATIAALQRDFPPAARRALSASIRETSGDGGALDRFGAFLRDQTGARSLDAREGDDPDAILSRAQAAVRTGDLTTALAEIESLPPSGQAEMADWVDRAQNRIAARAALSDLTTAQNSN